MTLPIKPSRALRTVLLSAAAAAAMPLATACTLDASPADERAEIGASSAAYTSYPSNVIVANVPQITSKNVALAIGGDNVLHVAYATSGFVMYQRLSAAGVAVGAPEKVGKITGTPALSIAVDGGNAVHIVYNEITFTRPPGGAAGEPSIDGALVEQTRGVSATWTRKIVEGSSTLYPTLVGASSSVAVDGSGGIHVAYASENADGGRTLFYNRKSSSVAAWGAPKAVLPVVSPQIELEVDLAVSASGVPHILFRNINGNLQYTTNTGSASSPVWPVSTVLTGLAGDGASYPPSLALDGSGAPSVAFVSRAKSSFGIVRKVGTVWGAEALGTIAFGTTPSWASLNFEAGAIPQIAYYNPASANLEFDRKEPAGWNRDTVHGGVGKLGDSVVDSGGKPHLVYFNATLQRLEHATAL